MQAVLSNILSKFSGITGSIGSDAAVLICLFVILFIIGMYFGRGNMVSLILSLTPAALIYKTFPFLDKVIFLSGDKLVIINKLCLLLIILIPIHIVVSKFIFAGGEGDSPAILKNSLLSIAGIIIILTISYNLISLDALHNFGSGIDTLFIGDNSLFYGLLATIALLAFV